MGTKPLFWDSATAQMRVDGAMTAYAAAVTAGAGSLGANPPTAVASYYRLGPLGYVYALITFPPNYSAGAPTASGSIKLGLPSTLAAGVNGGFGREIAVAGTALHVMGFAGQPNVLISRLPDFAFVAGNSYQIELGFWSLHT